MKIHIDTAPIWESYRQDCECPLCLLHAKVEEANASYFLGESVMEPSQRIEVNQKGFCEKHFKMMYDAGNRLGLGLITHTYLKETIKSLKTIIESIDKNVTEGTQGFFKRITPGSSNMFEKPVAALSGIQNSCVMCERLNDSMQRYIYTILYMYKHESEFPKLFAESKGMCLKHFSETIEMAPRHLSGSTLTGFVKTLGEIELKNFARLEEEIDWFTRKFDYRNESKPWGNSRDAVKRSINKLRCLVIDN